MSKEKFLQFIKEIAYGRDEWEYENGDSMQKDAKKFLSDLRKLESENEKLKRTMESS